MTELIRATNETRIRLELARGTGRAAANTGVRFLDHMLVTLARYSGLDLTVEAGGDLKHHLIEDVAIVLGAALREMLPDTVARYGDRTVPMDDALVQVSLDLGGRAYYQGPLPSSYYEHFMQSFAANAVATVHVQVIRGRDRHHVVEAAFKALGLALRDALVDSGAVFSTKGAVALARRNRSDGGRDREANPAVPPREAGAAPESADRVPRRTGAAGAGVMGAAPDAAPESAGRAPRRTAAGAGAGVTGAAPGAAPVPGGGREERG